MESKKRDDPIENRKSWNVLRNFGDAHKMPTAREMQKWDIGEVKELLHKTEKVLELEGNLLRNFLRNRSLRLERAKIVSLMKISEFWMGNEIKRAEALHHLENVCARYNPPTPGDFKVIPELKKAFELRDQLRREKKNFTKDDYYLTIDEMFEKQYDFYHSLSENPSPVMKRFWTEFCRLKEKAEAGALKTGDKIKHFELPDESGKMISTRELLKEGPLVLSFFRGTWCPYCINELCVLADSIPRIKALGANLISVGTDKHAFRYFRKLGVIGDIVFDEGMKISKDLYNLAHPYTKVMEEIHTNANFFLAEWTGGPKYLPIPATYIIDSDGTIVYDYVKIEYYKRMDPREIVQELYKLFDKRTKEEHSTILGKRKHSQITPDETATEESEKPSEKEDKYALSGPPRKKIRVFDHVTEVMNKK